MVRPSSRRVKRPIWAKSLKLSMQTAPCVCKRAITVWSCRENKSETDLCVLWKKRAWFAACNKSEIKMQTRFSNTRWRCSLRGRWTRRGRNGNVARVRIHPKTGKFCFSFVLKSKSTIVLNRDTQLLKCNSWRHRSRYMTRITIYFGKAMVFIKYDLFLHVSSQWTSGSQPGCRGTLGCHLQYPGVPRANAFFNILLKIHFQTVIKPWSKIVWVRHWVPQNIILFCRVPQA